MFCTTLCYKTDKDVKGYMQVTASICINSCLSFHAILTTGNGTPFVSGAYALGHL